MSQGFALRWVEWEGGGCKLSRLRNLYLSGFWFGWEGMAKRGNGSNVSAANRGFEAKLWLAADKLRNNMDAAEYKHVVLGLIFLKYISDSFEEHRAKLVEGKGEFEGAGPEERDEYLAHNASQGSTRASENGRYA